ncbi:mitochondrial ribosomal protein subunit L20-domain-containing protein [Tuber borchii]|uniref:Mitochondrial ribosomal protein subunit L20-domain-containing protein n=1 Tax=Tuber borchii TaxID=42251 RepID=A0A2T7A866_TUBBO|nr:mitochondrial ribosomal protein subunit L20-domain-containing protein [Tuber borchii]
MINSSAFLRRCLPAVRSTTSASLTFVRHESNTRRHTKRLRMPPHPDFKTRPTTDSPSLTYILRNPPAAAPSVFITPTLFLPKDDPRRALQAAAGRTNGTPKKPKLPPPVTEIKEKKYHLTPTDFSRMRSLRKSNPNVWTRGKLAEEFGTSRFFAGMIAEADDKRKEKMWAKMEKVKERWGPRRRNARIDRARRREGWGGADGY